MEVCWQKSSRSGIGPILKFWKKNFVKGRAGQSYRNGGGIVVNRFGTTLSPIKRFGFADLRWKEGRRRIGGQHEAERERNRGFNSFSV